MKTFSLPFNVALRFSGGSGGPCRDACSLTSPTTDYIQHIGSTLASLSPCSIPQRLYRQAQALLRSLLPWSNLASKTGIQYSRTM